MKFISFFVLVVSIFCTFFTAATQAVFKSPIFRYDDPQQNAKGLHVSLEGETWAAREVLAADLPGYQGILNNPAVMQQFGNGELLPPPLIQQRLETAWLPRFRDGHPHGPLTVTDHKAQYMGYVVASAGEAPGVSELAYAYLPDQWGKGVGSAVVKTIVQTWAPEVRRIGLGTDLNPEEDVNIIRAFNCFGGQPLQRIDATARLSNQASGKILIKNGFKAAQNNVCKDIPPIDFVDHPVDSLGALETRLARFYDGSADTALEVGKRYRLIDPEGHLRTFSRKERGYFSYHFEYTLSP